MNNYLIIKKYNRKITFFIILTIMSFMLITNQSSASSIKKHLSIEQIELIKVTINVTDKSIDDIMKILGKQTKLEYGFHGDVKINTNEKFSITAENKSLKSVLDELFNSSIYNYVIVEDRVIISNKKNINTKAQPQKRRELKGKVVDGKGETLTGVTVITADGSGAITDDKGAFILTNIKDGESIEVSYIGMFSVKLVIKPTDTDIVVTLKSDVLAVDDIVVTGIFKRSKESYTGVVTTITAKDMKMFRGQNVLATLRNIDPSLAFIQNNDVGSNPNVLPEMSIRGNSSIPTSINDLNRDATDQLNSPLVVMDGFEISLEKLMDFNDEEIETITILKDASATAIYGSRGANGVIVVTRKMPEAGKLKLFVSTGISFEMPDLSSYDLLNASDKLEFERTIGIYDSDNPSIQFSKMQLYYEKLRDIGAGVETDWLAQPLRTGIGQDYNARLEGGSNEFRWGVSLGYDKTLGVMKGSERNVFSGSINLAYTYKNIIIRNQLSVGHTKGDESNYGIFSDYTKLNPYWSIYDKDSGEMNKSWDDTDRTKTIAHNPLYIAGLNQKNYSKNSNILNNFDVEWRATNDFSIRAKLGLYKDFRSKDVFKPSSHPSFEGAVGDDFFRRGEYKYNTGEQYSYDAAVNFQYSKNINEKHLVAAGLDFALNETNDYFYDFKFEGYSDDNFNFLPNAAHYDDEKPSGDESVTRSVGATMFANYIYDNRYFADGSFRYDGASQFGTDNKFAPFYTIGIGWNIYREKFLEDSNIISNLRLRASYGITGSQQFDAYRARTMYNYILDDRYGYDNTAVLQGFGNKNLKWQTTKESNIGLEIGLLEGRINAEVNVYSKKTTDFLSELDLPTSTGFSSYYANVGTVENKGFDMSLSGYIIRDSKREIFWTITGRLAYNSNKITELSDAILEQNKKYLEDQKTLPDDEKNQDIKLLFEGDPVNSIYEAQSLGIDPGSGQELFLDSNGNATYSYDPYNLKYAGEENPKYRGNLSSMFSYKNFTVNVSFGYHWGGQQYNQTLINKVEVTKSQAELNVDRRANEDRWLKKGDVKFYKSFYEIDGVTPHTESTQKSSRFVQDDNMFSMQSANIEYRWNSKWVKENLKMQSVNFSVNMSDIFYISSIKRERGLDYPFARRVSIGLALVF